MLLTLRAGRIAAMATALLVCFAGRTHATETPPELPAVIDALEVNGLWRTQRFVVERELPWKPGETVSQEAWEQGIARLWNIALFSRVAARVERRADGRRVAVLALEERWTIMLMTQFAGGGGAAWLRTGLYDINTLGRFIETGVLYERFQRFNGAQAWLRMPRLFDERQELFVAASRLVRPRSGFSLLRSALQLEYTRQLHDHLIVGGRVEGLLDAFEAPLEGEERRPRESNTLRFSAAVRRGRVDPVRLLATGWQLEARPLLGVTDARGYFGFGQLTLEALWFRVLHERLGLATRFMAGVSTAAQEQHRFFIGGLDMIRGYRDSHARGPAYLLANAELRGIVFDSTWVAVMPVIFLDAGVVADDERGATGMASLGPGLRILIPRLYRSGLRIDLPFTIAGARRVGFAFGVYQFFGP